VQAKAAGKESFPTSAPSVQEKDMSLGTAKSQPQAAWYVGKLMARCITWAINAPAKALLLKFMIT